MKRIACLLVALLLAALVAAAQETRGTIRGTVKDPQGGVVAGAEVMVTNADTNVSVKLKTNENGRFDAPLLLPGNYAVTAEAPGFKKMVRAGITLQLSDVTDVEMTLQVGAATESVTVTSEAPLVDVTKTDSGHVLDDRSVQDLPVMANTVFTMIRYGAGVASGGPPILLGPHSTQGGSDYSTGSGVGGNHWTIDGGINDGNARYTANLPSVEAVSETKIVNTTFDANFGHSTGLGVAVSTKTGNNLFHGSAAENYWSQRWQGSGLFVKQLYYKNIAAAQAAGNTALVQSLSAQPIQPSGHSNLWALNVTGPIWIPKIIDLRNKVFFAFNYNGEKDAKPEESTTYNRIVPTPANKTGDFSDLLGIAINPAGYQLYDPLSVRVDPARAGHYLRTAIPGNKLPASYINMGKKFYDNYVKYWPDPNNWFDHTQAPNTNPFLSITAPYNWLFNQYSGRLDVNLSSKLRAFGTYRQNHFVEIRGDWTNQIVSGLNASNGGVTGGAGGSSGVTRDDQGGVLDLIYTLTPSTIAHAAFSISNWSSMNSVGEYSFQFKPSDVGLPKYMDDKCALSRCYLPQMNIGGYSTNGLGGIPAPVYNRFLTYNADVYHNRGNHSFHGGVDIRQQVRSIHAGNNDGQYTFGNNYFRQCDDNCGTTYSPATIGLSWASFMMGLPTGITISNNDSAVVSNPYWAGYLQDTWRVTPKFTLTLSLRIEWEDGYKERYNRWISGYDASAVLPITAAAQAAYAANPIPEMPAANFKVLGGALYSGTAGAPERFTQSQTMLLPRIGFGYQINSKTVVRGGYGIYFDTNDVNATSAGPNQTGFSRGTNPTITTDQGINWLVGDPKNFVSALNDPFPVRAATGGTRFDVPLGNALGNMALNQSGNAWTFPNYRHARQQRWRLSLEHQIGASNVVTADYEGTYTSDMNVNISDSFIPSTYYYMNSTARPINSAGTTVACSATVTTGCLYDNYMTANVNNPFNIANFASLATSSPVIYQDMTTKSFYTSTTTQRQNLIRKYPSGNITRGYPIGHTRSQMFDISFNHRFSHGLTANFAYTWMQTRTATGFLQPWNATDPTNPQVPFWGNAPGGNPYKITATWVYDLPFGKGRKWFTEGILNQVLGGFALSGTYEAAPGGLIGFGNTYYYGDINNVKIDNPTIGHYFNTAGCVASAAAAQSGDTVVAIGQPCTAGFDKRSGVGPGTFQMRSSQPTYVPGLRNPSYQQWNFSASRNFKIYERVTFQFRVDAFNAMNHSFLAGVTTGLTSANFGQIINGGQQANRFIQIQGHVRW